MVPTVELVLNHETNGGRMVNSYARANSSAYQLL